METFKFILALLCCLTACQWNLEEIELANAQATCIQNCVNGTCNSNNICECKTDWHGVNCDTPIANTNTQFCDTTNCNNGTCNEALNKCNCEDGWYGTGCLRTFNDRISTFQKVLSFGENEIKVDGIICTDDGGYLFTGYKHDNSSSQEQYFIFTLKINNLGLVLWESSIEVDYRWISGGSLLEIKDGYLVGSNDRRLIKYSKEGAILYEKRLEGSISLFKILNNKIYIFGHDLISNLNTNIWIANITELGEIIWSKNYGGSRNDYCGDVFILNDGFLILGESYSNDYNIPLNYGGNDVILVKTDFLGEFIWSKSYGGSKTDSGNSISLKSDGSFLLGGFTYSNDNNVSNNYGSYDFWLLNCDLNGNLIWERNFGGSSSDKLYSIVDINDGNFYLAGSTFSKDHDVSFDGHTGFFWLIKVNQNGEIIWQKGYGNNKRQELYNMKATIDGGFIMVGQQDRQDIYIVKTDANGNLYTF